MALTEITRAEQEKLAEHYRQKIAEGKGKNGYWHFDSWYPPMWVPSDKQTLKAIEEMLADSSKWVYRG